MNKIAVLGSLAKAASDLDNTKADGTINWDFVAADVYDDMNPTSEEDANFLDMMLDSFAEGYEYRTRVGVRPNYS